MRAPVTMAGGPVRAALDPGVRAGGPAARPPPQWDE